MESKEQAEKSRKYRRRNRKLKKLCTVLAAAAFAGGILSGFVVSSVVSAVKSNRAQEAFNQQMDQQKESNAKLQAEFDRTAEGLGQKSKDASWNMILVNAQHPLSEDFEVELAELEGEYSLDARIVDAAREMLEAGEKEGMKFYVCSAYRDSEDQEEIFNYTFGEWLNEGYSYVEAYNETKKSVMEPGCSEHATGLAIDILSQEYMEMDEKQAETKEAQWLSKHCAEYGFILRYPPEKSDITGVIYEPWHYRYVGKEMAKEITEQGLTLEEYYMAQ